MASILWGDTGVHANTDDKRRSFDAIQKKSMTHKLNAEWTSSRGSGRGFQWEGLILETKNARLKLRIGLVLPFLREEKHLQRARKRARARVHAH